MSLVEVIEKALHDYDWTNGRGADSKKMAAFISKRISEWMLYMVGERIDSEELKYRA